MIHDLTIRNQTRKKLYYDLNNRYTSITTDYANANKKSIILSNQLMEYINTAISIPTLDAHFYFYKVLIVGNDYHFTDELIKDNPIAKFNNNVKQVVKNFNNRNDNNQVIANSTEFNFKNNYNIIHTHNHMLLMLDHKLNNNDKKYLEKRLGIIKYQTFKDCNNNPIVLSNKSKPSKRSKEYFQKYITYIFKCTAIKPFKNWYEYTKFKLSKST